MIRLSIVAALLASATAAGAQAADAPAELKLGTLYASSGRYASISMPVHYGLKLWIDQKNADGGVYIKAFDKKIPLKLIAYDDQSNTATAATLYNQLITQDKVDILIADSGSVLTSVAVPIARDHKMLLIDQTGTGANFFTPDNPYIALMADPVSSIWPKPLADFLIHDGPGLGIKRIAMLYATNDFTGTQASSIRKFLGESNAGVELGERGVPVLLCNQRVDFRRVVAHRSTLRDHGGLLRIGRRARQQHDGEAAQGRGGEGRGASRAAAGRFHRLGSGCYTPTHSNKRSARSVEPHTVFRHSWSSRLDRSLTAAPGAPVCCCMRYTCFVLSLYRAGIRSGRGAHEKHCGFLSTHASSLWNHCASTTRSRVTSKLSCRCKRASYGCTSAG
jgi:hypothetical protein